MDILDSTDQVPAQDLNTGVVSTLLLCRPLLLHDRHKSGKDPCCTRKLHSHIHDPRRRTAGTEGSIPLVHLQGLSIAVLGSQRDRQLNQTEKWKSKAYFLRSFFYKILCQLALNSVIWGKTHGVKMKRRKCVSTLCPESFKYTGLQHVCTHENLWQEDFNLSILVKLPFNFYTSGYYHILAHLRPEWT